MNMKVSDYIAQFLYQKNVTHIYEVVGGMITHLIDSVHRQGKIQLISTHHEQAAAFAAEGMARMTGVPGVALATSGPGATNLLTGIGSCYFDSVPAVFITGQVNREEQRGNRAIRQFGFQETDIISMARPITKAAWQIQEPNEVPTILKKAFHLATSGRPGPILLDIPMDVQRAEISVHDSTLADERPEDINDALLSDLIDKMKNARRPLILAGGGINSARVPDLFRQFADQVKIPVVNSLMAVDALSYGHPLRVGMIGTYGNRWANLAIGQADFLLVLGSRLDIRQTGSDTNAFKKNKIIYHVDCDIGEVNNRITGCYPIISQLSSFLVSMLQKLKDQNVPNYSVWIDEINKLRIKWPDTQEIPHLSGINPNELMHQISKASGQAAAFAVDVGQHQMWAAQSMELSGNQRFMTTGGMGAMGFALPAAIGAALACPKQPVVMIAGDGSFQLNLQELQTVIHHKLPLKMVIVNNKCYGMVRQFQESYFDERYASTYWGYSAPDFGSVARVYGIESKTIDSPDNVADGVKRMWQNPYDPFLLEVMIDPSVNVFPKIAFGLPITEMEPFAKPTAMEST
jgi:acetolactate synthase-1/2/3 large subunit